MDFDMFRRSDRLLSAILENAVDAFVVIKAIKVCDQITDYTWVLVSNSAKKITKRSQSELLGNRLSKVFPEAIEEYGLLTRFNEVLRTGQKQTIDLHYQGSGLDTWLAIQILKLDRDRILLIFRDFSDSLSDPLTKIGNRRCFDKAESCTYIYYIDIDRLKSINDEAGHAYGDRILQEVGARLKQVTRRTDTIARIGGDEFVVIVYDELTKELAINMGDRLLEEIEKPFTINLRHFQITASIGIAPFIESNENTLRLADLAMYRRKSDRSLSPIQLFQAEEVGGDTFEKEIKRAIENEEFILFYQPIVDLQVNNYPIIGYEALIRWNHPTKGLLSPVHFIPEAERMGLIHLISAQVLQQANAQLAEWNKLGKNLSVGINLSAKDFQRRSLIKTVSNLLEQMLIDPNAVILELTETSFADVNATEMQAIATKLKEIGVQLAIDDFGTGWSTLLHLHLPVDILKIDRQFVHGKDRDFAICDMIIILAHKRGLKVIAEGIENLDELRAMTDLGADHGQGYFIGKPMHPEEIIKTEAF